MVSHPANSVKHGWYRPDRPPYTDAGYPLPLTAGCQNADSTAEQADILPFFDLLGDGWLLGMDGETLPP
jgi:hypothetical protein